MPVGSANGDGAIEVAVSRYPVQTFRAFWVCQQMQNALYSFVLCLQYLHGTQTGSIPGYVWLPTGGLGGEL